MRFLFENHVLDTDTRELWRGDVAIQVQPQVFDLLTYLVQNRERVVTKNDLLAGVWGGRTVADSTLATHINAARKAVGDNGEDQKLIRTISRKGIRFIADVSFPPASQVSDGMAAPQRSPRTALPSPERPAIAVLPFVNMSGEARQEYFSDGISEDIITALSKLRWFFVIARNSTFTYKGKPVNVKQLASELGVGYVVEGSVRKDGGRVRITAQLIDTATGSHLWANRYDRELADVFSVQDEITDAIVASIEPHLYAAENFRARRKAPENLDAWDLVMRALWHFWRITSEDFRIAEQLAEQAIAIDPGYAQAHAMLAISHATGVQMGWEDRTVALPIAERAALTAVKIDNEDPWAHLGLAFTQARLARHDESRTSFETALQLNPNFSLAHGIYGLVLSWSGRAREGAESARRALRLSPRDPLAAMYYAVIAYAAYIERDYAESVALCRKSIRLRDTFTAGWRVMVAAAGMIGDTAVAAEAMEGYRRTLPGVTLAKAEEQLRVIPQDERAHFLEGLRRAGLT